MGREKRRRQLYIDPGARREVPTDSAAATLGDSALATEPITVQLFVRPAAAASSAGRCRLTPS